jgi:hypothetical protein
MTHPYKLRKYHNPENIDESLVPDGWRFRYADEMPHKAQTRCKASSHYIWTRLSNWQGTCFGNTYIVPVA